FGRRRLAFPEAAKLCLTLEGRRPEMRTGATGRAADRVNPDNGADGEAARGDGARRTKPALQIIGGQAIADPGRAERECLAELRRRLVAEIPVRRAPAPFLVAAIVEIEQDGAGDDRHARLADGIASSHFQ